MKKTFKFVGIVFLITLLYFALTLLLTHILYRTVFGQVEYPKRTLYLRYDDVNDDYARSEISFISGKNRLQGHIYGDKNKKGIVVLAPGLGAGEEDYVNFICYFADKGWMVLGYNNTGTYNSEGSGAIGVEQSTLDLSAALTFLESDKRFDNLPVVLMGHSWGGYGVASVLGFGHNISAAVSVSGIDTPQEFLAEQGAELTSHLLMKIIAPSSIIYDKALFGRYANRSATDAINSVDTPIMIIHGTDDEAVFFGGSSLISKRDRITNPNAVFVVREGYDHYPICPKDARSYYIEVEAKWLEIEEKYDGKVPDDVANAFFKTVNKEKCSALEISFMNKINAFFEDAVK